jgi:hypothetical protein
MIKKKKGATAKKKKGGSVLKKNTKNKVKKPSKIVKKKQKKEIVTPVIIEDTKPKRVKQNYFDNKLVEELVVRYQKGKYTDVRLYNEIMTHLDKIVIAIINKYHFYYYYNYQDLAQEGRMACMSSLKTFDLKRVKQPGKSVFSYFSNVVKRNLRFFTLNKNRKIIKETKVDPAKLATYAIFNQKKETDFFEGRQKVFEFFAYLKRILFKDKKRMLNLVFILEKYIKEVSGSNFKSKDFVAYCKSFGYTSDYTKRFMNIIKENKSELE